jgi:hypothetical protein
MIFLTESYANYMRKVKNPQGNILLGRRTSGRWNDNIKANRKDIGDDVDLNLSATA